MEQEAIPIYIAPEHLNVLYRAIAEKRRTLERCARRENQLEAGILHIYEAELKTLGARAD